jgi:8-oxo-dGTP pyrophosphatase MutT (NUDIX family)
VTLRHTLRRWRDRLTLMLSTAAAARQSGAIPYALVDGKTVFLIITSRRTGRWIFPKGGAIEGKTPWEVAAHEAFEEAGVEGEIESVPIGAYRDVKTDGSRRTAIEVDLYPLRVVREIEDWPEKASRRRRWVILSEAERLLAVPRTAKLAALLARRLAPNDRR